jgi:hypothetical protein
MRAALKVAGLCAVATVLATAANADPYFNRYRDGSWLNVEYNDGVCHYYYSHNSYDNETHVNRYGDCSQIAIGPNGEAVPLVPMTEPPY